MHWSKYKSKSSFSKIPLFVCGLIFTMAPQQAFSGIQDVPSTLEVKSEEEAFLVRRIAEFWKDKDYILVKRQIHTYLEKFPSSPINDQLRGMLGDLNLQDKKYQEAIQCYDKIKDPLVTEKIIINKLQCYYELNQYVDLLKEGKPYLSIAAKKLSDRKEELQFLIAESYFRIALDSNDISFKQENANQARILYETLNSSSFAKHSKLALAEAYNILKQYDKAAYLYLDLAQQYSEQKEELLNQAALSQSEYDAKSAIQTFTEVISLNGKKANDAAMNRLILFFQEEQYDEVIKHFDEVSDKVPQDKKATFDYIAGRSYFATQDYLNATDFLAKYISSQSTASLQLKNALLMQLNCAQKNNQDTLADATTEQFKTFFEGEKEFSQALFIHSMIAKKRGDLKTTEDELYNIIQNNNFDDKESLLLEYGLITHENGKWDTSYKVLRDFITIFPKSQNYSTALKYYLSCTLNKAKDLDLPEASYNRSKFYEDLTFVLNEQSSRKDILTIEEEKDCRLLSAKTAFELKKYPPAIKQFETYLKDYPTDANLSEVYLLLGISHQNMDADPELFYANIEKAIAFDPSLATQSSLHLQLYNSYINKIQNLGSKNSKSDKNSLYDSAAEHLYKAFSLGDNMIKPENKLWLANHYYQAAKLEPKNISSDNCKRAQEVYKTILFTNETNTLISLTKENISLEAEVLKYCELLTYQNQQQSKVTILRSLAEQQTKNPSFAWNFRMQGLLELASAYESLQQNENALDTYSFITANTKNNPSYVYDYAQLHEIRLRFSALDSDLKNEKNENVLMMLNHLKDLQIRKTPSSEPLHLEAALAYAKIRTDVSNSEEREEKYLFYLGRILEDYSSTEDPTAKEYHKKLASSIDKKEMVASYVNFIDAEILRTKANMELKKNRLKKAEEYNSLALGKLSEVKSNQKITAYLNDNVQKSMKMIDQSQNF